MVLAPEGLYVNRKTQLVFFRKLQRSDIELLPIIVYLRSKKERNYQGIQPNRSALFFRVNLRKTFFHADLGRKNTLIYLRNLPDPQQQINRKSKLIQPIRSAEFFRANLRKTFFTLILGEKNR